MKNLISWVEIPATDIARAAKFYRSVLNIDLEVVDCGEEKMACLPFGQGAICLSPGFKPSADGVLVSFNAGDDLDGAISRVSENQGRLVQQKTAITASDRGHFALVVDTEGNRVGLYGAA